MVFGRLERISDRVGHLRGTLAISQPRAATSGLQPFLSAQKLFVAA